MKVLCTISLLFALVFCYAQPPLTEIQGRLAIYPESDTTSIHIGKHAGEGQVGFNNRFNTFVGTNNGRSIFNETDNSFFGSNAGRFVAGANNTFLGSRAGRLFDGDNNVLVGDWTGACLQGSGNVFVGSNAGPHERNLACTTSVMDNRLFIHNSFTPDPLIYGEFDNDLLRINGDLEVEAKSIHMRNLGTGDAEGITFREGEIPVFGIIYDGVGNGGDNRLHVRDMFGTHSDLMTIKNDGNIGIGTDAPTHLLDVAGMARIRILPNETTSVFPVYARAAGGPGGVLVTNTSDARLKENMAPISDAIRVIGKMKPYYYNYISDSTKVKDAGLLAQDLEKIVPQATFTNPSTGYKGIIYEKLTPFLVEAIKVQQAVLERQKSELEDQQLQIEALKNSILKIEQSLDLN